MSIPGAASPLLFASVAAEAAAYQIDRSVRLNSADSAYFSRTPSSAGNRKTWTWSGWVKRANLNNGTEQVLFSAGTSDSQVTRLGFDGEALQFRHFPGSNSMRLVTEQVFRDPSSWYHIVCACDTTQSTASNRAKLYVNGTEITTFSTAIYSSQNTDTFVNGANIHGIGAQNAASIVFLQNAYLADVYLIDGVSGLTASDFGEYDDNNVWQPKAYSGTYGTNGFHLDFSDNSSNAALGDDSSGNNNDWTVNNLVADAPATASGGFDVVTYSGNSSTQNITGLNFQPDFVWIKSRTTTGFHNYLLDSVRGATKRLISNETFAESTVSQSLTAFNSDGFSLGSEQSVNKTGDNYVAWCWKAGGTAVSNPDGTITSSVSANDTYGFSVINHTGTGAAGTFGHGLSSAPDFLIFKNRDATDNWFVWTRALNSATTGGVLNSANAFFTNGVNELNSTLPTDSVIHVGNNLATNGNGQEVICYAWTEVSGFSKFGSYSGNGSTQKLTFGFKPAYVIFKRTDSSTGGDWYIFDNKRVSGTGENLLRANTNADDDSAVDYFSFDAGGITLKTGNTLNGSGRSYIYAAFADKPDGSIIDSLIDTPTNADTPTDTGAGGEVVGNYATLNPLANSGLTLSNGNLDFTSDASNRDTCISTIAVSSGKWYWELTVDGSSDSIGVGIEPLGYYPASDSRIGSNSAGYAWWLDRQQKYHDNTSASYGASVSNDAVIGVALDLDAGTLTFYLNNSSQGVAYSGISGTYLPAVCDVSNTLSAAGSLNFGQRAFAYTAPSGYKALCTANLPDPTIADGSTAMDATLYTGNGSTQTISGLGFSPDFVWLKNRANTVGHNLYDVIRGVNKPLITNSTAAEESTNIYGAVSAFNSDGFDVQVGSTDATRANATSTSYVGWAWDGGTSNATNTDGSITSTVRANASAGFSIVTFNMGSNGAKTVGHSLNAEPHLIITKCRTDAFAWRTYHKSATTINQTLELNSTGAVATSVGHWGSAAPTSSVFGITSGQAQPANQDCVAYCFAPVDGYSSFGSYTGNNSADGTFVYTGFRPRWVIIKSINSIGDWIVWDTARDTYNVSRALLYPNTSGAEQDGIGDRSPDVIIDILSNGFKCRETNNDYNASEPYIYAAFGDPFKTARAR